MTGSPGPGWEREIESGEMAVKVDSGGVMLIGPGGAEPLSDVQIERLYQALIDYREHSNLNWRWAREGSGWWK